MLHLGCEIEFMSDNRPHDVGFDIHNEYYSHMYEINSFHATGETVADLVHQLRDHIKAVMGALAPYEVTFEHAQQIAGGFGFTGIHLHIQDDENIPVTNRAGYNKARAISKEVIGRIARHRGLSLRQLVSHHIWGGRVASDDHDWKNNSRFNPVLYNTRLQTYEVRCIDFDMLLPDYQRKLINVLKSAFDIVAGADNKKCKVYNAVVERLNPDRVAIASYVNTLMQYVEYSAGQRGVKEWLFSPHEERTKYVYLTHRLALVNEENWVLMRERRTEHTNDGDGLDLMADNPKVNRSILQEAGTIVMRGTMVKEPPVTLNTVTVNTANTVTVNTAPVSMEIAGVTRLGELVDHYIDRLATRPLPTPNRQALLQAFVRRVEQNALWGAVKQDMIAWILRSLPTAQDMRDIYQLIEDAVMANDAVRLGNGTAGLIREANVEWGTEESMPVLERILDSFICVGNDDAYKVKALVRLGNMSRWEFSYIFAMHPATSTAISDNRTRVLLDIRFGRN